MSSGTLLICCFSSFSHHLSSYDPLTLSLSISVSLLASHLLILCQITHHATTRFLNPGKQSAPKSLMLICLLTFSPTASFSLFPNSLLITTVKALSCLNIWIYEEINLVSFIIGLSPYFTKHIIPKWHWPIWCHYSIMCKQPHGLNLGEIHGL